MLGFLIENKDNGDNPRKNQGMTIQFFIQRISKEN